MKFGVVLPMAEDGDTGQTTSYNGLRARARQAEADGLDSVWVFDHLLFRWPNRPTLGIWEAWTLLTAIAEATERVEVGAIVLCNAFRNPAVLAKMAVTLDEISDGRLILGLGAGWHEPEFRAFGLPFDHLVSRFEESLRIITPLLRTGEVDFHGNFVQAKEAVLRPRGPRPMGPPILIGAAKPRMLRLTAEYADAWNTCWLGRVSATFSTRHAEFVATCAEVGRDAADVAVTVGIQVNFEPPLEPVDPTYVLSGSEDEISTALREWAEAGADHLICQLSPTTSETLQRFATIVRSARA